MVGSRPLAALLFAMALAGCSGGGAGAGEGTTSSEPPTTGPFGTVGNATLPRMLDPVLVTLYLSASGTLVPTLPTAGSVPIGTPVGGLANGIQPPAFATAPAGHALLVGPEDIAVTLYVSSQAPQPSNGAFDLAFWFGSTLQTGLGLITTGSALHPPGSPQVFERTLEFGSLVPLFVPGDEALVLQVTGSFGGEAGEPHLLVGGDTPSRIEVTLHNYTIDPLAGLVASAPESFTGQVANASGPACAELEGSTALHEFTVAADAAQVVLRLTRTGSTLPGADQDLGVFDGAGAIAGSSGPYPTEGIRLAAETLAGLQGKTLVARVHGCGPGAIQYGLEIEQSRLPASA